MHWRPPRVRRIFASCKDGNPPDTTTVARILGGWTCGALGPTASRFDCNDNPGLTAIPPGLFDFTPALSTLYGRLRPAMGRGRPPTQAPRSPATILGNRIALPSCVL